MKKCSTNFYSEEDEVFSQKKLMLADLNLWEKSLLRMKNQKIWNTIPGSFGLKNLG
jgi:hypothetical protein